LPQQVDDLCDVACAFAIAEVVIEQDVGDAAQFH